MIVISANDIQISKKPTFSSTFMEKGKSSRNLKVRNSQVHLHARSIRIGTSTSLVRWENPKSTVLLCSAILTKQFPETMTIMKSYNPIAIERLK